MIAVDRVEASAASTPAELAAEAGQAFAYGFPRAAAVLARAAIELHVVELGRLHDVRPKRLFPTFHGRVERLRAAGLVDADQARRWRRAYKIGSAAAHGRPVCELSVRWLLAIAAELSAAPPAVFWLPLLSSFSRDDPHLAAETSVFL
jgi:hypothetical protein